MDALLREFGLQGLVIGIAVILSLVANRRIRALELHDEDQDLDHLELVFELYDAGTIGHDFIRAFIQRKRGSNHGSKGVLSDMLESLIT
jgi:hypothetical protein